MSSASRQSLSSNLLSIDLIRGLASLWVVIFHINEPIPYQPGWWTNFCKLGWLGVPAFFVVSGFCMGMLEERSTPRVFLAARLARIYPPYLASLGVVLGAVVLLRLVYGVNDAVVLPKNMRDWIATVFLLFDPLTGVQSINWVYWSLVVEVCFYIYFALCLTVGRHRTVVLLLPMLLYPYMDVDVFGISPLIWIKHYPVFLVGYFLYRSLAHPGWTTLVALGSMIAVCIVTKTPAEFLVVSATIAAIAALPDFKNSFPTRITRFFGQISYSLYLIHVPVACFLLLKIRNHFVDGPIWLHFMVDMILVIVTVLAATAFYYLIESPSHRWSRKLQRT